MPANIGEGCKRIWLENTPSSGAKTRNECVGLAFRSHVQASTSSRFGVCAHPLPFECQCSEGKEREVHHDKGDEQLMAKGGKREMQRLGPLRPAEVSLVRRHPAGFQHQEPRELGEGEAQSKEATDKNVRGRNQGASQMNRQCEQGGKPTSSCHTMK